MPQVDVDVDYIYRDDEKRYAIRLAMDACELTVHVPMTDVSKIAEVRSTPWLKGALQIGESADAPAFWSVGDDEETKDTVSILLGHDDQTWDIAVRMPVSVIDDIARAIAKRDAEKE